MIVINGLFPRFAVFHFLTTTTRRPSCNVYPHATITTVILIKKNARILEYYFFFLFLTTIRWFPCRCFTFCHTRLFHPRATPINYPTNNTRTTVGVTYEPYVCDCQRSICYEFMYYYYHNIVRIIVISSRLNI